jgi:4-amino-4-deoxy-L-arabinose transferase-like glycosyltransferase
MNATIPAPSSRPPQSLTAPASARWRPTSVALIVFSWLILHIGCLFSPGLLDDVDSVYIEIARQMLVRHDLVTPYIDGIRFFDKPPLMFWLAAGSMHLFGATVWAARLPLALLTLALLLATYALGLRLFTAISPAHAPDRGALYAALALGTSIGPFLYTRFFIPDIAVTLWLTLSIHLFLLALDRAHNSVIPTEARPTYNSAVISTEAQRAQWRDPLLQKDTALHSPQTHTPERHPSPLLPILAFAATLAASLLTKGFIGLIFPLGFAFLYLALTRQLRRLKHLHLPAATALFLALALPWHILAALRNPAIALPPGLGLPARGGWAWFYLYNEHIARFLSRRIPHDYGQVPIPLFWLLAAVWLIPWVAFLPGALHGRLRDLRHATAAPRCHQATVTLLLWIALVLGFFTLSARQEYYSLPALPALALLIGGLLARADRNRSPEDHLARQFALTWSRWFLIPLGSVLAAAAAFFAFTARTTPPGTDIAALLSHSTDSYNLSLSHLSDLTPSAMGLFRLPLALCALAMLIIGPICYAVRRSGRTFAANLTLAAASTLLLLAIHTGLTLFYPILGSQALAQSILADQQIDQQAHPASAASDLILIDGELTAGSTLLFYTHQPVHLVDGRVNGPWYGSFWPDAPPIFETDASLHQLWSGPRRLYLLTDAAATRLPDLARFASTRVLQTSGGKAILTNRPR